MPRREPGARATERRHGRRGIRSSGQLNRAYHLLLIVPRLQPVAAEILSRLHTLAQRYVQAHLRPEGRAKRAAREHARAAEGLERGEIAGSPCADSCAHQIDARRSAERYGEILRRHVYNPALAALAVQGISMPLP